MDERVIIFGRGYTGDPGWGASAVRLVGLGLLSLVVLFTPFANVLSCLLLADEFLSSADVIVIFGGGTTRDGSLSEISLWRAALFFKVGHEDAALVLYRWKGWV